MTSLNFSLMSKPSLFPRLLARNKVHDLCQSGGWRRCGAIASCSCLNSQIPASQFSKVCQIRLMSSFRTDVEDEPIKLSKLGQKISDMRLRIGLRSRDNGYYMRRSVILYEAIDDVKAKDFFNEFDLENTFASWFRVAELHLWMILVRSRAEGDEGIFVNKCIMQYMWEDVRRRAKELAKGTSGSTINEGLQIFYQEMLAAFIAYDEGLDSDIALASALWNRLLLKNCNDPVLLEKLVKYVRKQIQHLDNITRDDFLGRAKVTWRPLLERE